MDKRKRFYVALALYVVLGVAIWFTVDNAPIMARPHDHLDWLGRITMRQATLVILSLFVLRTVLHWYAEQAREKRESEQSSS
ncbi:MAG TPA: hypothetical protein VJ723_05500 [Candidatus Angelobacter sp.]|nr:hypothetical protein [Candidatus Angelobacter sp.]